MSRWLVLTLVGTCLGAVVMACADPVGPAVDTEQPLVAPRPDAPPLEHVRQHAIEAGMPQEQLEAVLALARDERPRRRARRWPPRPQMPSSSSQRLKRCPTSSARFGCTTCARSWRCTTRSTRSGATGSAR